MSKKILAILMAVAMAFSLLPATALAVETDDGTDGGTPTVTVPDGKAKLNGTEYNSVFEAVQAAAETEMNTIYLGKGTYTLYGTVSGSASINNYTTGKRFTFIGAGRNETTWMIGAPAPDPEKLGTEYNADYSFGGCQKVVFQNMTLSSYYEKKNDTKDSNYLGFAHTIDTEVVDCTINGLTFYWGYTSAMFKNTTFNCPDGDYAIWTYSSATMTFDNCTFNSSGKVINVYNENSAADYTINFNNCTVNSSNSDSLSVMNINDSPVEKFTINFTGTNKVTGIKADGITSTDGSHASPAKDTANGYKTSEQATCSKLFEFNMKYGNGNNGKTIVNIDGKTVWENGKMVSHAINTAHDKYTDGYKDNAFTTTEPDWTFNPQDGKMHRTVTKTCKYCGDKEVTQETKDPTPVEPDDPNAPVWQTSKSKTAINLDNNYESKVTLSLPSAEEKLDSDIVFVVDKSESSEKESALSMLDAIRNQIDKGTKVNVGVVTFNTVATQNGFFDLNADYEAIKEKFNAPVTSGTNLHAGILAGVDMLNKSSTDNNRKYLIVISDGITYTYDKDAKIVPYYWLNDGQPYFSKDPYSWNFKYGAGTTFTTDQWNTWRSKVENILKSETISPVLYSEIGTLTKENGVPAPQDGNYTSSVDRALYYSYLAYQSASEKYHCYAIPAHTSKESAYPYGVSFMGYLGGNKEASFNEIENDILYLIDTGSYVEDYMGYVDSNYNFDFINDASKLTITVGKGDAQEKLDAVKIDDNHYGFGPVTVETDSSDKVPTYHYNLEYIPGNMTDTEHFVWRINVPVENFAPVALTYSVKLVNPKSASGTYGQYDADGSKNYSGLYTNNSATLHPKDSNENWGIPENFQNPTVSYTVSGGNSGGNNGGNSKPSLNTKDHYGYIIGYPVDYYTGQPTTDQTKKPVRPEGKITRAEVATIYFRMLTDESRTKFWSQSNSYSDVKAGDWFNNAVSTLSNAGIIAGYEDGSFRPNGYITRAEFATIAARFFDVTYNGKDLFPDISGHWAKDYINQAANKGFVNGYEDGTFKPDRNITRAEAVTLVNRTLDRHPDKNHFTKDMLVWPDNMDQTKWYYADMQEATNSHTYQMKENSDKTKYENWTKTLPIRNWEALEKAWSNANSSQGNGNVV